MLAHVANAQPSNDSPKQCFDFRAGLVKLAPELKGRAMRLTRSPAAADDLVQDSIERAIRFESYFERGTNLRAWMHQVLFSVFITKCRRQKRERNALGALYTDPCAWTKQDERSEMVALSPPVRRALESVPKVFREALVMVDMEERSYKDAAKRLGVPVGTVMSRLHRGRKAMAQAMRAADEETGALLDAA